MRTELPTQFSGLPAIITIQKGTTSIKFTSADRAIILGTDVWLPQPGADLTGLQVPSDGTAANADVTVMAGIGPGYIFAPGDGNRGVYDNWPITIELIDPNNPIHEEPPFLTGIIGSVDEAGNMLTIAANGLLQQAQYRPMVEYFALTGREVLGDDHCKLPICCTENIGDFDIQRNQTFVLPNIVTGLLKVADAYGRVRTGSAGDVTDYANVVYQCTAPGVTDPTTAPSYNPTVGATTSDGTATFLTLEGWTRYAFGQALDPFHIQLAALPDPRASDVTWFVPGRVFIRSGNLSGFPAIPVTGWDPATLTMRLALPVAVVDIPAGTQLEVIPGCDETRVMCFTRFNNIINLRAETFVPPPDVSINF